MAERCQQRQSESYLAPKVIPSLGEAGAQHEGSCGETDCDTADQHK